MRRVHLVTLVCSALLYAGAYAAARRAGWLVHRCGYRTDSGGARVVDGHSVSRHNSGPLGDVANAGSELLFTPLRVTEAAVWHVVKPPASRF